MYGNPKGPVPRHWQHLAAEMFHVEPPPFRPSMDTRHLIELCYRDGVKQRLRDVLSLLPPETDENHTGRTGPGLTQYVVSRMGTISWWNR